MWAIETHALTKRFRSGKQAVQAVTQLDLQIGMSQVYGFLGPNGAGKTTTIRMLLDLIRPTSGEALLFGRSVRRDLEVLQRVGALVEGATFYPYLTGRRNLEVLARTSGSYDKARIQMLIEQVGMSDRAERRAGGYSTGMKQRLGIAAALLGNPDLVILDEPTNGLDPAGIQEMRSFVRHLADEQGKTVFLSSHLLNEVEQVCDRVAIIHKGRIVREGKVQELLSQGARLRVQAAPLPVAEAIIARHWSFSAENGHLLVEAHREDAPYLIEQLVAGGVQVYEVVSQRQSLEAYFLSVTQGDEVSDVESVSR